MVIIKEVCEFLMLVALYINLRPREWPANFSYKVRDGRFEMLGMDGLEQPSRLLAPWLEVSVHESSFAHSNPSLNTSCYSLCSDIEENRLGDYEENFASEKTTYLIVNPVERSHRN